MPRNKKTPRCQNKRLWPPGPTGSFHGQRLLPSWWTGIDQPRPSWLRPGCSMVFGNGLPPSRGRPRIILIFIPTGTGSMPCPCVVVPWPWIPAFGGVDEWVNSRQIAALLYSSRTRPVSTARAARSPWKGRPWWHASMPIPDGTRLLRGPVADPFHLPVVLSGVPVRCHASHRIRNGGPYRCLPPLFQARTGIWPDHS